jgi:hypothetical protein
MDAGSVLLRQVRNAGALGNELDVQPLRDPQVEGLRSAAAVAEARADAVAATQAKQRAAACAVAPPNRY